MNQFIREIEQNFLQFSDNWKSNMLSVTGELEKSKDKYLKSYNRLVSIQSWRLLLETKISSDSLAFFLEAQNDALTSHVFARLGSWRSALKSLRSCIENVLYSLYYMDHPVELQLWHQGNHKLGFLELYKYYESHPQMANLDIQLTGLPLLREEYGTLSKAVHGSAKGFRMTVDAQSTLLWSDNKASLGAWTTREKTTIFGINLLLIALFREQLQGSSQPNLRNSISLAIPATSYKKIKDSMGVTLVKL